ncbi:hypothetical protein RIR_jg19817.t1 [Rhizophagus irregularis DAOM 181602=DAOM 197198]|nr:hypothetical protein RIR_jg19817.t1 [Rhizophagus irregularis DAOM 181602=DAOM 197198]
MVLKTIFNKKNISVYRHHHKILPKFIAGFWRGFGKQPYLKRGYENLSKIINNNDDDIPIISPNSFDRACFADMNDEFWLQTDCEGKEEGCNLGLDQEVDQEVEIEDEIEVEIENGTEVKIEEEVEAGPHIEDKDIIKF